MSYITEEEMNDISTYILLPLLLDLVGKYMWFPDITPLKHLHPDQFQQLLDMITIDHIEVKQRLKTADIKVEKNWKGGPSLDYKIFVRGYSENHFYWRNAVKAQMSIKLGQYVGMLDKSKFKAKSRANPKNEVVQDCNLFVNF